MKERKGSSMKEPWPPKSSELYIKDCLKTLSMDMSKIKNRLNVDYTIHMLHAVMGMATEAGELLDMLKKHIFYGKELDLVNLEEELGDLDWYQSLAIHSARLKDHHTSWETIWDKNIAKLKSRYGNKFSEERAEERDLGKERGILERSSCDIVDVNGDDYLVDIHGSDFSVTRKSYIVGQGFYLYGRVFWRTTALPEAVLEELDTYLMQALQEGNSTL
ncbi:MAG: nucleoside triphosphate pyrophosphohydrolase family protein [Desulforhopalus sp.]